MLHRGFWPRFGGSGTKQRLLLSSYEFSLNSNAIACAYVHVEVRFIDMTRQARCGTSLQNLECKIQPLTANTMNGYDTLQFNWCAPVFILATVYGVYFQCDNRIKAWYNIRPLRFLFKASNFFLPILCTLSYFSTPSNQNSARKKLLNKTCYSIDF